MNENVNNSCICELGYDKGAYKKQIENNIFTIFGNISKNSSIVLRYHGELIDNICYEKYENNLYIKYFFNDDKNTESKTKLAKCTKCVGENYCALIELKDYNKITFSFCLKEDLAKTNIMSFNLNITENLLYSFLDKYENKTNSNLPTLQTKNELKLKNIIQSITNFFSTLKRKITSV